MEEKRVRQNYPAILVAAVACFLFEAGWYTIFLQTWIDGIGRSREWLMSQAVNPLLQYATALLSAALIAMAISCVTATWEQKLQWSAPAACRSRPRQVC